MNKINTWLASLMILSIVPTTLLAADSYTSILKNKSDPKNGYYLVQTLIYGEKCIQTPQKGVNKIIPGESTLLKMKKDCTWGGVRYKIYTVSNNKNVGTLSHNFRDGKFNIEIAVDCHGTECNFYDLNPNQQR